MLIKEKIERLVILTQYIWIQDSLSTYCILGPVLGLHAWDGKSPQGDTAVNGGSLSRTTCSSPFC